MNLEEAGEFFGKWHAFWGAQIKIAQEAKKDIERRMKVIDILWELGQNKDKRVSIRLMFPESRFCNIDFESGGELSEFLRQASEILKPEAYLDNPEQSDLFPE